MNKVKKMLKSAAGFTLVELVVVMVIIGILALVAVPLYRGYMRRAMASEAKALVGAVANAERVYYAEHNTLTTNQSDLNIDCGTNRYFNTYDISGTAGRALSVITRGIGDAANISVTLTQTVGVGGTSPTITETGY